MLVLFSGFFDIPSLTDTFVPIRDPSWQSTLFLFYDFSSYLSSVSICVQCHPSFLCALYEFYAVYIFVLIRVNSRQKPPFLAFSCNCSQTNSALSGNTQKSGAFYCGHACRTSNPLLFKDIGSEVYVLHKYMPGNEDRGIYEQLRTKITH